MCCLNGCNGPCMGENIDKFCLLPGNAIIGTGGVITLIVGVLTGGMYGIIAAVGGSLVAAHQVTEAVRKKYNWKYIRMGHDMQKANEINEDGAKIAINIGKTAYIIRKAADSLAAENDKERKEIDDIDKRASVELDRLEKGATSLKDQQQAIGKVTDWLQSNLETMNITLKGLNQLQKNASETADKADEKLKRLEKHATKAGKQVDRIKNNNEELGGLIGTLQSVMANLNEQVGEAQRNMQERNEQMQEFERQIEQMTNERSQHEEQMEKLAVQIKELKNAEKMLSDFQQEIDGKSEKSVGDMVEDELVNAHETAVALRLKFKNSLKSIIETTEKLLSKKKKEKKKTKAESNMIQQLEEQLGDLKTNLVNFEALETNIQTQIDGDIEESKKGPDAKFNTLEDLNEAVRTYREKFEVSENTGKILDALHNHTDRIIKGVLTSFPKGALLASQIYQVAKPFMKNNLSTHAESEEESDGEHDIENPKE